MERAKIMGIVNVTPDSFSDGGEFLDPERAIAHGRKLAAEGADILDIGGESTRPGARAVGAEEELRRVRPVVEALAADGSAVSIDTSKAAVAEAALHAGAAMVNDVTALRADPELAGLCAERGSEVVLMHMLGDPRTMQDDPRYDDVVREVGDFLVERADAARAAGIADTALAVDPGIGFGKTTAHNLDLLAHLDVLIARVGLPLVVGTSRKRFIGRVLADLGGETGEPPAERRDDGTLATTVWAVELGARVVRVHDAKAASRAIDLLELIEQVVTVEAA